jgi:hypothetical protein
VSDDVLREIEEGEDKEHNMESEALHSSDFASGLGEEKSDIGLATEAPDRVLRRALAIIFGIFPAADISVVEAEEASSFIEQASLIEQDRPAAFGRNIEKRTLKHGHQRRLQKAVATAIALSAAAARKVTLAKHDHLVKKWMGSDTLQVKQEVSAMFGKVVSSLNNVLIVPGGFCTGTPGVTLAYVYNGIFGKTITGNMFRGRHVIQVCPALFLLSRPFWFFDYTLGGVLVHEATHHSGTLDYAYGRKKCARLAKDNPKKAKWNADSYMFLSQELNTIGN